MPVGQTRTLLELGAEAALLLVARYFPRPWKLGDARVFTGGRLAVWQQWSHLDTHDQKRICRFLRVRRDSLADDPVFFNHAKEVIEKGQTLVWEPQAEKQPELEFKDKSVDSEFRILKGLKLDPYIDQLLDEIERRTRTKSRNAIRRGQGDRDDSVLLRSRDLSFTVPWPEISEHYQNHPYHLDIAKSPTEVAIDRNELISVANALKEAGFSSIDYPSVLEEQLLPGLLTAEGVNYSGRIRLPAGTTHLFVAPTGRGKSVLMRLVALIRARSAPVALIMPDIKATMKTCHQLEKEAAALGRSFSIVPINSVHSSATTVLKALTHPPSFDPNGAWIFEKLSYSCRLSAYADEEEPKVGEEPCTRLRQIRRRGSQSVRCPFAADCSKFDTIRAALDADILVINHAAFLTGKIPIELALAQQQPALHSMAELILARCDPILIDEIDLFQEKAADMGGGGMRLSSLQRTSAPKQLLDEMETLQASLQQAPRLDKARQALYPLTMRAEILAELLDRRELRWPRQPGRDGLVWPTYQDAFLLEKLWQDSEKLQPKRLDIVCSIQPGSLDEAEGRLQQALRPWVALGGDMDLHDPRVLKANVVQALADWPHSSWAESRRESIRGRVTDALILRTILHSLTRGINHVRSQLPLLEEHGLDSASDVRKQLLGYMPWMPSPRGPLGRRALGFGYQYDPALERGVITTCALTGDPHGFVATLGEQTALALTGTKRRVLGFSATARFRGSPTMDVCAPILLMQEDQDDNTIRVRSAQVLDKQGTPLRISGISKSTERQKQTRALGLGLWQQILCEHLDTLAHREATQDRARVLLVTGSYREAEWVAAGLADAIEDRAQIRQRLRCLRKERSDRELVHTLLPRELEDFARTGADVLVAPLKCVSRGHNILQPENPRLSALASIFVLVRPVPPSSDPRRSLAHLSYQAMRALPTVEPARPGQALERERKRAQQGFRTLQRNALAFSRMDPRLVHEALCDVLGELEQLVGRGRRGLTDIDMFLVDAAFDDANASWAALFQRSFEIWRKSGDLDVMRRLHRPFIAALQRYADGK